jgi:hypothetical protein
MSATVQLPGNWREQLGEGEHPDLIAAAADTADYIEIVDRDVWRRECRIDSDLWRDLGRRIALHHSAPATVRPTRSRPRERRPSTRARRTARTTGDDDPPGEHSGPSDAPGRASADLTPVRPAARVGHAGHAARRALCAGGRRL